MRKRLWSAMILLAASLTCSAELIAQYQFLNNLNDTSGSAVTNNLTTGAGTITFSPAATQRAVELGSQSAIFDGASWASTPLADLTEQTYAFWMKPAAARTYVLARDPTTRFEIRIFDQEVLVYGAGSIRIDTRSDASKLYAPINRWTHIAVTVNEDGADTEMRLYVNGEYFGNFIGTAGVVSGEPLFVGARAFNNGATPFEGSLADVRVYSEVLDASAISNLVHQAPTLIAHYEFNDNLNDTSGSAVTNNLGVGDGAVTYTDVGLPESLDGKKAAVFDGESFVWVPSGISQQAHTYAFWIRPIGEDRSFGFSLHSDNNNRTDFDVKAVVESTHLIGVNVATSALPAYFPANHRGPIPNDQWSHIAFTFDQSTGDFKLYINGKEDSSTIVPEARRVIGGDLYLGKRGHSTSPFWFTGQFADVRLYNHVLGVNEIRVLAGLPEAIPVTVEGAEAVSKIYDGGTAAEITGGTLVGVDSEHDVSITNRVGVFAQATVGTDIAVTAQLQLTGEDAWRYSLEQPEGLTADITPRNLTITAKDLQKVQGYLLTFAGTEILTDGLVGGNTVTNVTLASDGAAAEAVVGTYDIVPSAAQGTGLDNYSIAYSNGTLTVVARALVSHYRFDEDLDDSVGSYDLANVAGNDEVTFATVDLANSTVTNAVVFNGSNYVRSGNTAQFSDQPTSVAFWIKPVGTARSQPFSIHTSDTNRWDLDVSAASNDEHTIRWYDVAARPLGQDRGPIPANEWTHLAFTYNAHTGALEAYINGVLDHTGTLASASAIEGQLIIGRRGYSTSPGRFTGEMADIRVYNYVIDQNEVRVLAGLPEAIPVTVEGAEAVSKIYDGGTAAEITGGTLVGVDSEHDVSITNRVGVFAQATVGTDIAVTAQLQLTGEDAWRYSLEQPEGLTADITPRNLTITAKDLQKVQGYVLTFAGTEFLTDGLVGGNTVTNVTLASDGAAAEAAVGTYDIVPSTAQGTGLDNYSIAYSNGTLTVVARQLVSHYLFDQDTTDSIGPYDLALVTGGGRVDPTYTTVNLANGAVTNAAVFNALQYHRSNDTTQFSNGPATIAFWVKPANTAQEAPLVVHVNNDVHTEFIFMATGNFRVYNDKVLKHNISSAYTAGEWMHVALTYDHETQDAILYLDGEDVGKQQLASFRGQLMLGRRGGTTVNAFSGQMADVRVYNYGLSAQEIADLMGEEEPVPPPDIESAVIAVDGSDVVVSLSFTPVSGKTYALQFNTNLVDGVWADVVSDATESPLLYTNEHAVGFFRIKVEE